jgi:formate-dependent nitrite reductase cytochrome c552 subunit
VRMENINKSTFRTVSQGFYYDNVSYATDWTHIYANGKLLEKADPKTFAYYGGISRMDAEDKNACYFEGNMIPKEYKDS